MTIVSNATGDYEAACVVLGRTGGTTAGSNTIVTDNDVLGRLIFTAADGVDMRATPAEIRSSVDDSSPAADAIAGNLEFYTNDGSGVAPTSRLIIDPSGKVGIGTNAPSSNLEVIATGSSLANTLRITSGTAGRGVYISAEQSATVAGAIDFRNGNVTTRYLDFRGEGVSRMVIQTDGNVGIGTTAPGAKLEVAGDTIITKSSGATKLRLFSGDNDPYISFGDNNTNLGGGG